MLDQVQTSSIVTYCYHEVEGEKGTGGFIYFLFSCFFSPRLAKEQTILTHPIKHFPQELYNLYILLNNYGGRNEKVCSILSLVFRTIANRMENLKKSWDFSIVNLHNFSHPFKSDAYLPVGELTIQFRYYVDSVVKV